MAEEDLKLEKGDNPVPRIRMSEYGTTGLKVRSGVVYEEEKYELRHPQWNREVKKMQRDAVVSQGVELIQMWMSRGTPEIIPFSEDQSDVDKAKFIEQCMQDMEHTWEEFMNDVFSYVWYGFAPIEMVFRKRLLDSGSSYNDGLIGWKKLPIRSQDTLDEWMFTPDGREFLGMKQNINGTQVGERLNNLLFQHPDGVIKIPKEKLCLFTYNGTRGDPNGRSPLKAAWQSWKFRCQLQMDEAVGIQRNMNGVPVYYAPPQYMSPDAKPEDKAVYDAIKNQIRNYQNNEQAGFVVPNIFDEHSKQRLFSLEPLEVKGSNQYNTNEIIARYNLEILTRMFADIIVMGQTSTGSFALSGSKTNLVEMYIEARLKEIGTVIRNTLFKTTFQMNGWDVKRLPNIKFTFAEDYDMDEFGKFIQRGGSIEMIPRTPKTVAWTMKAAGYPDWQEFEKMSQEEIEKLFPQYEGKAGTGMGTSGTGDSQAGGKGSSINSDNAA